MELALDPHFKYNPNHTGECDSVKSFLAVISEESNVDIPNIASMPHVFRPCFVLRRQDNVRPTVRRGDIMEVRP